MAASAKEKFDAAVKVIHSLPKDGAFQPSNLMKLQFYAFYKQATQGKCNIPRPSFWDVVGKAKWDAWNDLGNMPKEQAMTNYVEQLKKIIEAMPHTTMVSEFVEKLGNFYELVDEADERAKERKLASTILNGSANRSVSQPAASEANVPVNTVNVPANTALEINVPDNYTAPKISVPEESMNILQSSPNKSLPDSESSLESGESSPEIIAMEETVEETIHSYSLPLKGAPIQFKANTSPHHNGVTHSNGFQHYNGERESDSETEEFCDTSDLLSNSPPTNGVAVLQVETKIKSSDSQRRQRNDSGLSVDHVDAILDQDERLGLGDMQAVSSRGGGDAGSDARGGSMQRWGSNASMGSAHGKGGARETGGNRRGHFPGAGGSGGGDRDPPYDPNSRSEVTEQIAVALVRLQQDMNSVLSRLQTLEALSLAHHQLTRSRSSSEGDRQDNGPWWWPFGNLSAKTVVAIVLWPFIVHWFMAVLARRRNRESSVSCDLGLTLKEFQLFPGTSIYLPVHPLYRLRKP